MTRHAPHPVFRMAPHLGFDVGPNQEDQHRLVLARERSRPNDWQGRRDIVQHRIPGSTRTLRQDMGANRLTLTTLVLFHNKKMFQRFWANHIHEGTFRMQSDWTVWDTDRVSWMLGVAYAEWDNVSIDDIADVTFDRRGVVHCTVTFSREVLAW